MDDTASQRRLETQRPGHLGQMALEQKKLSLSWNRCRSTQHSRHRFIAVFFLLERHLGHVPWSLSVLRLGLCTTSRLAPWTRGESKAPLHCCHVDCKKKIKKPVKKRVQSSAFGPELESGLQAQKRNLCCVRQYGRPQKRGRNMHPKTEP